MKRILFISFLMTASLLVFSQKTFQGSSENNYFLSANRYEDEKIIDMIKKWDMNIIGSRVETVTKEYLKSKCTEVKEFIKVKYPQYGDIDKIVDVDDYAAPIFCLFYSMWEANDFKTLTSDPEGVKSLITKAKIPAWLKCTLETIGVSWGISEITATLGTFETASAWKIAKFFVKKYIVGWLATAAAIYDVATTCFF